MFEGHSGRIAECLTGLFFLGNHRRFKGLDPEDKVKNMKQPDTAQNDLPHPKLIHDDKADGHQQGDGNHNADFGLPGHALTFDEGS